MSDRAERLQDAIGLVKDEYVLEAHGEELEDAGSVTEMAQVQAAPAHAQTADSSQAEPKAPEPKAPEPKPQTANAKVIKMPEQRRRKRAVIPIAIAACLVLVLGVGALAFTNMNRPAAEEAVILTESSSAAKGESEPREVMMADAADTGAREAAGAESESYGLTPAQPPFERMPGEAFVLTAGEWNDNNNWAFFTNLVNAGAVSFPSFGLDPTHRVKATVVDKSGNPVRNEVVRLLDSAGNELWRGVSDKDGAAYLFYLDGQNPEKVSAGGIEEFIGVVTVDSEEQQGEPLVRPAEDVTLTVNSEPMMTAQLQVMFIVDTTGSMSDEIAYLQKDFAAIAGDVGNDGVEYSVNFYRDNGDEYVTKCNGFTDNVAEVQALLNAEYADGGGDAPEAVADILAETITNNGEWRDGCNKVAFLIFDAPPHDGTDEVIKTAVESAAAQGIRLVPVVASNADRETELFGRALAIMTDGTYVFLTDDSGVGESHLEPIVGDYTVELLHDVIVRIIQDNR